MASFDVKLEAFEGPMDLLCHLIEKNEIDIYDIPIAVLADQYLAYIENIPRDMDILSEFLVMAAMLLEIKSKMLLPKPVDNAETEDVDYREELVNRYVEYKRMKQAAETLRRYESEAAHIHYKPPDHTLRSLFSPPDTGIEDLLENVTIQLLFRLFEDVYTRRDYQADKMRQSFGFVRKDRYTIEDKIRYIQDLLYIHRSIQFLALLFSCATKAEMVTTFLALLEMMKHNQVEIEQPHVFDEIVIRAAQDADKPES